MPNPIVSVVVPARDNESFLSIAIESVLAQSFEDFELLVVSDGATQRSMALCREHPDSRVRVISRTDLGAHNSGIGEARGRYIAFLESDDAWMPDKLERHVAHLDAFPEVGVSYSYSAFVDDKGHRLGHYRVIGASPTSLTLCIGRNPVGNGSSVVVRADVFDTEHPNCEGRRVEYFLFDEELDQAEGFELWVRIASQTRWRMECIPFPLTLSRVRSEGPSVDIRAKRGYHYLALTKIHHYAPELVASQRTTSIAYLYWHLARVLLLKRDPRSGLDHCIAAWRFSRSTFSMDAFLLIAALGLQTILPPPAYCKAERLALQGLGKIQERSMKRQQRATAVYARPKKGLTAHAKP